MTSLVSEIKVTTGMKEMVLSNADTHIHIQTTRFSTRVLGAYMSSTQGRFQIKVPDI